MPHYQMLIDGQRVDSTQHIDVINPATGEVFARVPHASVADADAAIAAAKAAQLHPSHRASSSRESRNWSSRANMPTVAMRLERTARDDIDHL